VLEERLGAGGMAEVFRASTLGVAGFRRQLAIKRILAQHASDHEFIAMLVDEAKIAVALRHPNIAEIYELGRAEGTYYIAMEYVQGKTLAAVLKDGAACGRPLPLALAVHIAMQVAAGLYAAHQAQDPSGRPLGVIHRDISPQNLLLGFGGEVKIIDFGVAKARHKIVQTTAGTIRGKLIYMSPEQVRAQPLDARSDLFSLGLVLYKMLVGRNPFEAASEVEVVARLRRCHIDPPRSLHDGVPRGLEAELMRTLARDPARRHPDAHALFLALREQLRILAPDLPADALARYLELLYPRALPPEPAGSAPAVRDALEPAPPPAPAEDPGAAGAAREITLPDAPDDLAGEPTVAVEPVSGRPTQAIDPDSFRSEGQRLPSPVLSALGPTLDAAAPTRRPTPPAVVHGYLPLTGAALPALRAADLGSEAAPPPATPGAWGSLCRGLAGARRLAGAHPRTSVALGLSALLGLGLALALGAQSGPPVPSSPPKLGEEGELSVAPVPGSASLVLRSQPSGARVLLDGDLLRAAAAEDPRGERRTPVALRDLSQGLHRVRLELPGHSPWEREIYARAGQELRMMAQLLPATGRLSVRTQPPGAEVFLDRAWVGRSPLELRDLPLEQTLHLRIQRAGFRAEELELRLQADQERLVDLALQR